MRRYCFLAAFAATAVTALPAQAGELYFQSGLPGIGVGYAQPINEWVGVRGDWVTLGKHKKTQSEEGIDYAAKLSSSRLGLFVDVFPFAGRFRFTGGLTSNNYKIEMDAQPNGSGIKVGNTTYTGTGDGLNVLIKFPTSTPYLGFGWGHQQDGGFRMASDIGVMIGKAKLTAVGRGALAGPSAQADIDRELAELSDGVGKIRILPQISFSLGYAF
jgi:hypothetical protein